MSFTYPGPAPQLPEWDSGRTPAENYDRRAGHLTDLAMQAAAGASLEVRAQVYATLAVAERTAELTCYLTSDLADIREAIPNR